jgi:hypothetical protein
MIKSVLKQAYVRKLKVCASKGTVKSNIEINSKVDNLEEYFNEFASLLVKQN